MNIGPLQFDHPICLAPMEDVTDAPFRLICKRLGADIVYTEFTSSDAIVRDIPKVMRKIKIYEEERPVAIQIFGGFEESMEGAAKKVESLKPDFIDINCGCWVRNHVARGCGAALLRDLSKFEKIVKSTVRGTKLPVTVKTRLGWDASSVVILDVAKMVEQTGVKALAVHCRTRAQAHEGEADWTWLSKIKKAISIPLIGNGDLQTPGDIKEMFGTGCDGVMIGRGAIGNPWIFNHTKHYLKTGELLSPPTLKEKIDVCIEHLQMSVQHAQYKGMRDGVTPFRKHYAGYLRGIPNVAKLRSELMHLVELDKVVECLYRFLEQHENIIQDVSV